MTLLALSTLVLSLLLGGSLTIHSTLVCHPATSSLSRTLTGWLIAFSGILLFWAVILGWLTPP